MGKQARLRTARKVIRRLVVQGLANVTEANTAYEKAKREKMNWKKRLETSK